ncbi:uncharacterized protein LOC121875164 [Homarus americanus]|uniref:uncharacterized protein LOC121875161 n=1 Tax=Homarus americanus TaxID=6706 RepID=UPI001C47A0C3|nr:uncharacterized protein LOC121875161 [Homarus americanus]XP_042235534.1 uncharacterized protein LOC121875164 [Homarus americanus]
MLRLLVVMTVVTVALGSSIIPNTPSCVFWCNYPNDVNAGASYCCINSNNNIIENTNPAGNPGRCVKHSFCARIERKPLTPIRCGHDDYCPNNEKCCYDACLGHHTCKAPLPH